MPASPVVKDPSNPKNLPRIVVIGAGFGGLSVARGLRLAPAFVTVIDKTNHNLFQPLLYQVATAALASSDIAVPVRGLFSDMPRVGTLMGDVDPASTRTRKVVQRQGHPRDSLTTTSCSPRAPSIPGSATTSGPSTPMC